MHAASASVRVPATSANLGPGFDCLGLALGILDEVTATVTPEPGVRVVVRGEGAAEVPADENHLVVRALRSTFDEIGVAQPRGLLLTCTNRVPHGRGLGSSAAAVVAGVLLGRALGGAAADDGAALGAATRLEGHPDNAAAALLGGATVAWLDDTGARAVRLDVHDDVVPLVMLASGRLATHHARAVLPASISHQDASFTVSRAALLVHALTREPALLLAATADRLHQRQRRSAMPETIDLVERLRDLGVAAVVSGAGPAVLVLSTVDREERDRAALAGLAGAGGSWRLFAPGVHRAPTVPTVATVATVR